MSDFWSDKSKERNVKVSGKVCSLCVIGVIGAFGFTCLSSYTVDRCTSLCKSVGSTAAVSEYKVKSGVNSFSVGVSKNRLNLGHRDARVGSCAVLDIRIYVGIVTLESLKTSFSDVSCVVTEFLKPFRSGVSKTNDYSRLRIAVSTDLLGVDRSGNMSVALNV